MCVQRLHQAEGRDVLRDIDMAAHGERVDARIGAARAVHPHLLARDAHCGLFHRLLDARPVLLALEAEEGRSVEFESESETGHAVSRK
jgi:hypothetical protein